MFKGLKKQKREIIFATITLVISILMIAIAIWSLQFLIVRLNASLAEPAVNVNDVAKFNLEKYKELNFENDI